MPGNFLSDPVGFMQDNLVVPHHEGIGKAQADAGVHTLALVKHASKAKQLGKEIDRWVLMKNYRRMNPSKIGAVFQAYWCPYDQNHTFSCQLGLDAPYMFTATMDGCSFGVGNQAGDGSCHVAHSNEAGFGASREAQFGMSGARQFQRGEQANRLTHRLGQGIDIIDPTHYMADLDQELVLKSTTFGIRAGNQWQFFTQKYWINGTTIYLREVTRQV